LAASVPPAAAAPVQRQQVTNVDFDFRYHHGRRHLLRFSSVHDAGGKADLNFLRRTGGRDGHDQLA
jgi:hypothetical protein